MLRARALPSGLVTLAVTQVGYGGLLFTFTLHLQAGLGQSALRAGLSYLPMAAVFGLAGYLWRRLPRPGGSSSRPGWPPAPSPAWPSRPACTPASAR